MDVTQCYVNWFYARVMLHRYHLPQYACLLAHRKGTPCAKSCLRRRPARRKPTLSSDTLEILMICYSK